MGTCTSTARHRQKQQPQLYKRKTSKKSSIVFANKPISPSPSLVYPNPHSRLTNFDVSSPSSIEPISHQNYTNSLIQLYSPKTNTICCMASSSSIPHTQPRIPVPKTRLPVHQTQSASRNETTTVNTTHQTGIIRPMSITNRAPTLHPSQTTTQPRVGFIPRPTAPGFQQAQASSLIARSRSISPGSTNDANSSSSSSSLVSPRSAKPLSIPKPSSNRTITTPSSTTNASKPKILAPSHNKQSLAPKSTATNRLRATTPSRATTGSTAISTPPIPPPSKTDVNAIRDRYKNQKRTNLFTRQTPVTNLLKSPSPESSSVIKAEQANNVKSPVINNQNDDSAYASIASPSNRPPSAYHSQGNRQRQRTASMFSTSSAMSDVLNQDAFLDDENCSLKSADLLCDYDDTLTLDSVSKTDQTNSCSSSSFSIETNKEPTMITPVATTKPNIPPFQSVSKEKRSATIARCSTLDKTNGNLRESLDELTQLSNRMDNIGDSEYNRRLLTRSVSLKPPPTSLPPRDDAEQITMDIESYRQVMKDVMVVKTVLHQLDRLLKHSDGANMTDSMVGSFHDSMIHSRRYSSSGDSTIRNSIDENASYDDLIKEIVILRKEREQDKQTIKLLQEQMYKYSSQTNG